MRPAQPLAPAGPPDPVRRCPQIPHEGRDDRCKLPLVNTLLSAFRRRVATRALHSAIRWCGNGGQRPGRCVTWRVEQGMTTRRPTIPIIPRPDDITSPPRQLRATTTARATDQLQWMMTEERRGWCPALELAINRHILPGSPCGLVSGTPCTDCNAGCRSWIHLEILFPARPALPVQSPPFLFGGRQRVPEAIATL
jgi:hypothetical protein